MILRVFCACAAALALFASAFAADVVVMKNGTMMEGTVDSMTQQTLRLMFPGGESTIQRTEIASVHLNATIDDVRKLLTPPTTPPVTPPVTPPPIGPAPGTPPVTAPPAPPPGPYETWANLGDVRVRITSARAGKVKVKEFTGRVKSTSNNRLIVDFEIQNVSANRTVTFRGVPFGDMFTCRNTDGRNNKPYRPSGFGESIEGQTQLPMDIPAQYMVNHIEYFDDVPGVEKGIVVTINGEGFGQPGTATLTIPAWAIAR